jgi:hypothetical protein
MSEDGPGFMLLNLREEEAIAVGTDGLGWIPVRRRLGIGAFGVNAYCAARAGDVAIEEHVESPGQEELYVVVQGRVRFRAGEDEHELAAGEAAFVADPDLRRGAVALEDGTLVLVVGGWRGRAYHSLPWEPIYLAQPAMRAGDWAEAAQTLEREAGDHRDSAIVQYRLACCHARAGRPEQALIELRHAVEANAAYAARAQDEEAFAKLRERADWPGGSA